MGWFNWFKAVVTPVVQAVEETVEFVKETVIDPIVDTVTQAVETVVEAVKTTAEKVVEEVEDAIGSLIDTTGEAAIDLVIEKVEDVVGEGYVPVDPDLSRFEPVSALAEQVPSQTIKSVDWTLDQEIEVRDAIVAAQIGYADYSELFAAGAVDADGYVLDAELVYETEGWLDGIVTWADDRFEIIRVLEESSSSFLASFEANVTLLQNNVTNEYYISVGGSDGFGDALSDITLILSEDTGASEDAISAIIAEFFEDDIEDGAIVNLAGHSLGGAEVVLQYRDNPELFDDVYAVQAVGIGGFDGTHYDQTIWDGIGDANITEITGDDPGNDFNDLVTSWGHIGAGQTFHVEEVILASDEPDLLRDLEVIDAHLLDNLWASLPGGEMPDLPVIDPGADVFAFV